MNLFHFSGRVQAVKTEKCKVFFLLKVLHAGSVFKKKCASGLIKQFLRDVDWGELDFLIIDTPPGTSDEHLSVVQYLSETNIDGAIILTTPQVNCLDFILG